MSYARMDHAAWVQEQIGPSKRMMTASVRRRPDGWAAAPDTLVPIQAKAFDILGMVFGGIYNAPISWKSVQWNRGGGLGVPISGFRCLSTFDFGHLTMLVFLAHEARIRVSVEPHGMRGMLISFYQRVDTGDMALRHPNLDEAVAAFRKYLPADHGIIYRAAGEGEAA